jgi:ASPM-SPD-2-Hydin domain-containing protein
VMLTNTGAVALTVTGIAVTGTDASQFSQTNNCSRVPPTYSCTIQVTFSPTVAGNARANLAVADNASGSPQLVSLSGVAVNGSGSELGLTIPSGGSSSQTVQAGRVATYTLSIGGMGWSGQVTLSCTGAPTGSTCSFPGGANINVSGGNVSQFRVTASTTAPSMAAVTPRSQLNSAWLWAMGLVGFVILPGSLKMKRARLGAGMMTVFLVLLCSCGGGGSGGGSGASGGTPAGTYTLTVKATAGSVNESLPLKLIVQ